MRNKRAVNEGTANSWHLGIINMSAAESVVSSIQHYQKSIQKYHGNSSRILHCINRLYQLPVTVQHLQDTGVGKTINSLRKSEGEVGEAARALVLKWKQMVEDEPENEPDSTTNSHAHSSYNGDSENESNGERLYKRGKDKTEKSSRDRKESPKHDHGKSQKRKKEPDYNNQKEKRHRSENDYSSHNSVPNSGGNVESEDVCSDGEWHASTYKNGDTNSDDDSCFGNGLTKGERHLSLDENALSDHDADNDHLAQSIDKESFHSKERDTRRQEKSNKKEKSSSHKHKSKSSSSSSDKNKHSSSSQSAHKESKSSSSSSSSRHKDDKNMSGSSFKKMETSVTERSEDKSKSKDKKEKHKEKHRSKEDKKSKDKKEKIKNEEEDGVDSFSGIGFGEALGMMFPPEKNKKKTTSSISFSMSPSKKKSRPSTSSVDRKSQANEARHSSSSLNIGQSLEIDADYGLPTLNPNYKPLPQPVFYNSPPKRYQTEEDDLSNIMYSKVQRTKVFSGNKTGYTYVPSLFELCTRVLQENIDALEYTGGVPFDLLKPVLERATAEQLSTLEDYNAYLIEDTDVFWEFHCKKEFRNKNREEMETWREMYARCQQERASKLKSLTAHIAAASKAKEEPVRKTKLAYIEGTVKPPRGIARKQARYGTAHASSSSTSKQDSSAMGSSFTGRSSSLASTGPAVSVPAPRGAGGSSSSQSSTCKPKPKAPLMQKALQLIKYNRFKR
ncbi:transcription elongation factor B polypeptide 3 [Thrips palmi]|uniref:Transcription elongation factor B polypeptide 3 n=1 Tax=Thrips palmi TaxID=161013 RepID=A0A6P9A057_THRPL|nr:transcription elongation factor B polypeptide 3 [Thrips palmi]